MNDEKMPLYSFIKPIIKFLYKILYKVEVIGNENIPINGGAIICPNHISFHDPLVFTVNIKRKLHFMAKNELFKNKILSFLLKRVGVYPVKRGEADLNAVKTTLRHLKEDRLVGIFPEGTRIKGGQLGEAHSGVAMFGIKAKKPVIPVYIESSYKLFSKVKIKIGKPVDLTIYKRDKMTNDDYYNISQIIMDKIKELKEGNN